MNLLEQATKEFPQYMNYRETLKYLNVGSYNTLYKFIAEGLKVTVVGSVKRINRRDADMFMQEHSI